MPDRSQSAFFRTLFLKHSWLIVLTAVASIPLLAFGVQRAMRGGNNDVRQWLPADFQETKDYDRFLATFGSEEMAVVSWPGATLGDERLDRVAEGLREYVSPTDTQAHAGTQQALFKRVMTTREALAELTTEPMNLPRGEAIARLRGTLLGADGKTAALVAMVNEAGAADRHAALDTIYRVAQAKAGLSHDDLRLGGPTIESVSLDNESARSRYMLASISVIVALVLAWRCLRHVRLVMMVFATSLLCAATSVAIVYFAGSTMNLLLVMMPTLIYVLALSAAVHLVNYYRDGIREGHGIDAPFAAVKAAWLPCSLSAGTTAVGLGSLAISEVVPVKLFGIFTAVGVVASMPILLLFLPAMLQLWPIRDVEDNAVPTAAPSWTTALAGWIVRHHQKIALTGIALLIGMGFGVSRLDTSVKLLNLFSPDSKIIRDYTWLEQHLGALVPIEVVVRFDEKNPLSMRQRLELVEQVQNSIGSIDEVGGTLSAATFVPEQPQETGVSRFVRSRVLDRRLEQNREYFEDVAYLHRDGEAELWRVSARVEALNSVDYGEFMDKIVDTVEPILAAAGETTALRPHATYTGIVPLIYKAQRTLLNDLMSSFFTAFLLVGGVMAVMLRSVRAGLVAMLPNILPAVTVFGAMGAVGMLCDIGSMMTAGVALGIAVDDTIHFLSWFRCGLDEGLTRREAISQAYERCAGAMIQTSIICGLGLLVFAFSAFVPTSHFAWLMATMLLMALLGDLLFLPALLAGPLGRFFERPTEVETESDEALAPLPVGA